MKPYYSGNGVMLGLEEKRGWGVRQDPDWDLVWMMASVTLTSWGAHKALDMKYQKNFGALRAAPVGCGLFYNLVN